MKELNERYAADNPAIPNWKRGSAPTNWPTRCSRPAPEAVDLTKETEATKKLYGIDEPETTRASARTACWRAGWSSAACVSSNSIAARAAAGTRTWISKAITRKCCRASDKPIAGLLDRSEIARTAGRHAGGLGRRIRPHAVQRKGQRAAITIRGASPCGWRAAASKRGQYIGTTDEIGLRAVERRSHVHDIHASILWLLGLDHVSLTYMHNGRAERPTITDGELIKELFA